MGRVGRYGLAILFGVLVWGAATASAAVTPGWLCIPTTAGQTVVAGGTGAAPSCTGNTTAVLAPTYVASGVGGKPTVEFSGENVQVVSGSGSTEGTVNGKGNLIVGYDENPGEFTRTGSNDLIVGTDNGWTGFGSIVGGYGNDAIGDFESVFDNGSTTGSGITPSPTSVTFSGSVPLGTLSAAMTATFTDAGPEPVQIGQVTLAGVDPEDFAVMTDSCSGAVLAPAGHCGVGLRFAPILTGARAATLELPTDHAGSPLQLPLSGVGGSAASGSAGPAGPSGAVGPRGPEGKPGKTKVITCTTVKSPGNKSRKTCTSRVAP